MVPKNINSCAAIPIQSRLIVAGMLPFMLSTKANAGFFKSSEQTAVDDIASYRKYVKDLLDQLKPTDIPNAIGVYSKQQLLKSNKEDSDVVLNYMEYYIKPLQQKMLEWAPKLKLDEKEKQERLEVLPLLMKGHIAELAEAIRKTNADDEAREVEEVQETLDEFLQLAALKYQVEQFSASKPLSDKELFGPFGCEFWGKKRAEGSNKCTD
jgi:hypothetical protein